ncbi:PHP domain-containing protein [bacterium]|nr:PHP domain-containing protein [bacterium]
MEKKKYIDLHIHTNYSDGVFTPVEAVNYAYKVGLAAISITDHDMVGGIKEAIVRGNECGLEVIPGVELSAKGQGEQEEIHILGYYINWENQDFLDKLCLFREKRKERAYKMLKKLNDLGLKITSRDILKFVEKGSIGRLHFAKALVEKKYVQNTKKAFDRYLGCGKPAYVAKYNWQPEKVIKFILKAEGIPVLAHPLCERVSEEFLRRLVGAGLAGIEIYHSRHEDRKLDILKKLAFKYNLLFTGGSDCHGRVGNRYPLMGTIKISYSVLDKLKKYKKIMEGKNEQVKNKC